jgi:mannose-6-phosphate isomerase-like protein (cupin superfamily)
MIDKLSCTSITQENFLDYDFDTICINNFSINNNDGPVTHVPGETYLFPTYAAYGHSLMDVYAQFKILQLKYKDIKPFFYENGFQEHYFKENKITIDQMDSLGYKHTRIFNLAIGNYSFEKVVLFFDMNNTIPEEFYISNGATRSSHYFPFCDCYMGTEPCGESKYFKYNYLAIETLKKSFESLLSSNKTEKFFISRQRYNKDYERQIRYYSNKESLSDEEKQRFIWAKARSTPQEAEIQSLFEKNGYTIVYAEDYTLFEQIKMFSSAKTIASISGTGLFNAFWCDKNTKVFEILSSVGYKYHYKEFAEYSGTDHEYIDIQNLSLEESLQKIEKSIKENKGVTKMSNHLVIDMDLVQKARDENRIHIFKNVFTDLPSLDTIMSVVSRYVDEDLTAFPDRSYRLNDFVEGESSDMRLKCRFWSRMAFQLYDPQDLYMSIIPELGPVTQWGLSQYPEDIYTGNFCLVSLMKNRGVVGSKHRDYVDQFQWVVKGEMIWRTGENLENEHHLVEGDFVFIPKNLDHEVETIKAPRAAINLILRN